MLALISLLGLVFGSFINAWVWRIKAKKPISNDRSECPRCRHKLAAIDLVPVLSWVGLRGKCRYCHKPISVQYPLVELLTAGLFALSYAAWDVGSYGTVLLLVVWLANLVLLVSLAVYDLKHLLLPDKMMRLLLIGSLVNLLLLGIFKSDGWLVLNHVLAGVAGGGFFYALYAVSRGKWMGGGDVKLVFIMGLLLGLSNTLVALFIAFNTAAVLSLGLILTKKLRRKDLIPFGPFLIGGTIIGMLYGSTAVGWYLQLVGIS